MCVPHVFICLFFGIVYEVANNNCHAPFHHPSAVSPHVCFKANKVDLEANKFQ
jgi:hypothetical protein